jgi:hypothetical protein
VVALDRIEISSISRVEHLRRTANDKDRVISNAELGMQEAGATLGRRDAKSAFRLCSPREYGMQEYADVARVSGWRQRLIDVRAIPFAQSLNAEPKNATVICADNQCGRSIIATVTSSQVGVLGGPHLRILAFSV